MTQDRITDGDHLMMNIDEALKDVGEVFTYTFCSDAFDMLPTGEENRAHSLNRIDLYQMRHVSTLHKNMIASLKQGKMKNKSTMYNTTCDDEDHASNPHDEMEAGKTEHFLEEVTASRFTTW